MNVVVLPPGQALPKTPDDLRNERIQTFLRQGKFAGVIGISKDPHHFLTSDTIPVDLSELKAPTGSLLRDQPLVNEVMRLDQQLMSQVQSTVGGASTIPLGRLDAPYVGADRQFDFTTHLAGCAASTRILGSVGGRGSRQVLNMMLPERKIAVVLWIEDANFDVGNLQGGTGFLPQLLSLVVCS